MPWEEEAMIRFSALFVLAFLSLAGYVHGQEKKDTEKVRMPVYIRTLDNVVSLETAKKITFYYQGAEKDAKDIKVQGTEFSFEINGEKELRFSEVKGFEKGQVNIFVGSFYVLVVHGTDLQPVVMVGKKK